MDRARYTVFMTLPAQRLKTRPKPHKLAIVAKVAIARRLATIAKAILGSGIPRQAKPIIWTLCQAVNHTTDSDTTRNPKTEFHLTRPAPFANLTRSPAKLAANNGRFGVCAQRD
jgi:hypothetical protein